MFTTNVKSHVNSFDGAYKAFPSTGSSTCPDTIWKFSLSVYKVRDYGMQIIAFGQFNKKHKGVRLKDLADHVVSQTLPMHQLRMRSSN